MMDERLKLSLCKGPLWGPKPDWNFYQKNFHSYKVSSQQQQHQQQTFRCSKQQELSHLGTCFHYARVGCSVTKIATLAKY